MYHVQWSPKLLIEITVGILETSSFPIARHILLLDISVGFTNTINFFHYGVLAASLILAAMQTPLTNFSSYYGALSNSGASVHQTLFG